MNAITTGNIAPSSAEKPIAKVPIAHKLADIINSGIRLPVLSENMPNIGAVRTINSCEIEFARPT